MKERPILFSGPMVRAILEGRKTMTRRVVKDHHVATQFGPWLPDGGQVVSPYGIPGDRLWVRETWLVLDRDGWWDSSAGKTELMKVGGLPRVNAVAYRSQCDSESERIRKEYGYKWRPSIHMPRWASRLTLEIISVRVERLQDIDDTDAEREGCDGSDMIPGYSINQFHSLWDSINLKRGYGWDANPWVWVVGFRSLP